MRRSKEELLQLANTIIGDSSTDEVLSFLEDIADSVGADEVELEGENWEIKFREATEKWEQEREENAKKYEELDNSWRKKYKERFLGKEETKEDKEKEEEYQESDTKTWDDIIG